MLTLIGTEIDTGVNNHICSQLTWQLLPQAVKISRLKFPYNPLNTLNTGDNKWVVVLQWLPKIPHFCNAGISAQSKGNISAQSPMGPLVLPLRQASVDQAVVEWLWACRGGFWQWECLERKLCYKSPQIRAQMWDPAEGLHTLMVMGQVWGWAFALRVPPGGEGEGVTQTWTQRKRLHCRKLMFTALSRWAQSCQLPLLPPRRGKPVVW